MSNEILGLLYTSSDVFAANTLLQTVASRTMLGVSAVGVEEARLALGECRVEPHSCAVGFIVTDRKSSRNASYLIDGVDYDEDADIGLPNRSIERLELIFELIRALFASDDVTQVSIGLMECGQIDEIRDLSISEMADSIEADMSEYSPPDILYNLRR